MENLKSLEKLVNLATVVCISAATIYAGKPDPNQLNVLNNNTNTQQCEQMDSWNRMQQMDSLNRVQPTNLVNQQLDIDGWKALLDLQVKSAQNLKMLREMEEMEYRARLLKHEKKRKKLIHDIDLQDKIEEDQQQKYLKKHYEGYMARKLHQQKYEETSYLPVKYVERVYLEDAELISRLTSRDFAQSVNACMEMQDKVLYAWEANMWRSELNDSVYNNTKLLNNLYTERYYSTVQYIKEYINPIFNKKLKKIRDFITNRIINKQKRINQKISDAKKIIDHKIDDKKKQIAQQISDKKKELSLAKSKNGKLQITKKNYRILEQFVEEKHNWLKQYIQEANEFIKSYIANENNFMKSYITTRKEQAEQRMEKLKNTVLQKIIDKRIKYEKECIDFKNKANAKATETRNKLFNWAASLTKDDPNYWIGQMTLKKTQVGNIIETDDELLSIKKLNGKIDKALKKFSNKKFKYNYTQE